jgi:hypothetical protein
MFVAINANSQTFARLAIAWQHWLRNFGTPTRLFHHCWLRKHFFFWCHFFTQLIRLFAVFLDWCKIWVEGKLVECRCLVIEGASQRAVSPQHRLFSSRDARRQEYLFANWQRCRSLRSHKNGILPCWFEWLRQTCCWTIQSFNNPISTACHQLGKLESECLRWTNQRNYDSTLNTTLQTSGRGSKTYCRDAKGMSE